MTAATKGVPLIKQYLAFLRSGKGFEHVMQKVKILSATDGNCKAEFNVQPEHANAYGVLHGGFSATLVDIVSGIALLSSKREAGGVSVNINMSFLKGTKVGEDVIIEAKTIKAGKNLGFLEIEIKHKETGDLLVKASHTKYIG